MREIILARIDDRLLHGQVVVKWIPHLEADAVIIIDDELDKNDFLKKVTLTAAPNTIEARITSVDNFKESFQTVKGRTLLIAKSPQVFESLISQGVEIKRIVLGGMGSGNDRKNLYRNIHVSTEEMASLIKMADHNVEVDIQIIPDDKPKNILKI
jgi:PTS system mannose-specific IIB component